jgi:hypothetical protein
VRSPSSKAADLLASSHQSSIKLPSYFIMFTMPYYDDVGQ